MTTVHQPKNTPISFAVDYDATSAQISGGMQDYFRAAASTMNSPGAANHYDFGWKGQANIESHIVVNGERLAYLGNVEMAVQQNRWRAGVCALRSATPAPDSGAGVADLSPADADCRSAIRETAARRCIRGKVLSGGLGVRPLRVCNTDSVSDGRFRTAAGSLKTQRKGARFLRSDPIARPWSRRLKSLLSARRPRRICRNFSPTARAPHR